MFVRLARTAATRTRSDVSKRPDPVRYTMETLAVWSVCLRVLLVEQVWEKKRPKSAVPPTINASPSWRVSKARA